VGRQAVTVPARRTGLGPATTSSSLVMPRSANASCGPEPTERRGVQITQPSGPKASANQQAKIPHTPIAGV